LTGVRRLSYTLLAWAQQNHPALLRWLFSGHFTPQAEKAKQLLQERAAAVLAASGGDSLEGGAPANKTSAREALACDGNSSFYDQDVRGKKYDVRASSVFPTARSNTV